MRDRAHYSNTPSLCSPEFEDSLPRRRLGEGGRTTTRTRTRTKRADSLPFQRFRRDLRGFSKPEPIRTIHLQHLCSRSNRFACKTHPATISEAVVAGRELIAVDLNSINADDAIIRIV